MAIVDARELADGDELGATVAIVGGGAAGIALARRLGQLRIPTLLLESGGEEFEDDTQALYAGTAERYYELTATRLRMLGGSTNHFGGQSRPLEAVDFEAQPWHGDAAWPIGRDEIVGHLDDAVATMGLLANQWDGASFFGSEPPELDGGELVAKLFQAVPMPFGRAYRDELAADPSVQVVLHANVVRLHLAPTSDRIASADVRTLTGRRLTAAATVFVLATGGIESPRLLLASTDEAPAGVGNSSGLVGRYFSDHPSLPLLEVVPTGVATPLRTIVRANEQTGFDVAVVETMCPSADTQRALGLPGFHAFLYDTATEAADPELSAGATAVVGLGRTIDTGVRAALFGFEQVPNPDSRVTLDGERDELGELRAHVRWQLTDEDEDNMRRSMELVGRALARGGMGRLRLPAADVALRDLAVGQHHHMGTLRMSASPTAGVVDGDLRFHDVTNLFAAGSSVFPVQGHVNPTLNLLALTYRLAERLRRELA